MVYIRTAGVLSELYKVLFTLGACTGRLQYLVVYVCVYMHAAKGICTKMDVPTGFMLKFST